MKQDDGLYGRIERILAPQRDSGPKDPALELAEILSSLPAPPPCSEDSGYAAYLAAQEKIKDLKQKLIQKNSELLEALRSEERLSREILSKTHSENIS